MQKFEKSRWRRAFPKGDRLVKRVPVLRVYTVLKVFSSSSVFLLRIQFKHDRLFSMSVSLTWRSAFLRRSGLGKEARVRSTRDTSANCDPAPSSIDEARRI